jgi:hypothetical protein
LYAIQANQPGIDISQKGRAGSGQFVAPDMLRGLSMAAGYAAAPLMFAVGPATGVFDRLAVELTNSYELGVEALPADGDGKRHSIRIEVSRPGVEVRGRREVITTARPATAVQRLADLMAQPVDTPDLPIAAAAYTVRGEAADSLKMIVVAEVARGSTAPPPVQYAVTVMDRQRRAVFQTNGNAEAAPNATVARAVFATQIAPGQYRLRVAAIDGLGRGGTVELPVVVGLRAADVLNFSDLVLGSPADSGRPAIACRAGDGITGLVELYAADPQVFSTITAEFELRAAGRDEVLVRQPGTIRGTDLERRWLAEGAIRTGSLPAGSYVVSAVLSIRSRPVGKVSRMIELTP